MTTRQSKKWGKCGIGQLKKQKIIKQHLPNGSTSLQMMGDDTSSLRVTGGLTGPIICATQRIGRNEENGQIGKGKVKPAILLVEERFRNGSREDEETFGLGGSTDHPKISNSPSPLRHPKFEFQEKKQTGTAQAGRS